MILCLVGVLCVGLSWGCTPALSCCCSGCQGDRRRQWSCREDSEWRLFCCYTQWPRSSAWP